jgi:integrase
MPFCYFYIEREGRKQRAAAAAAVWGNKKNCPPGERLVEGVAGLSLQQKLDLVSKAMADASISNSTADSYEVHWRRWTEYVEVRLAEFELVATRADEEMRDWDWETRVKFLVDFFSYLFAFKGFSAGSLESCSSGVKRQLSGRGVDVKVFEDARCIQARAGSHLFERLYHCLPVPKVPITLESVQAMVRDMLKAGDKRGEMIATAVLMGFFSGLRASEYVSTASSGEHGHVIRFGDVAFRTMRPDAWVAAENLTLSQVKRVGAMSVTLRSAKNDQRGAGSRWMFERNNEEYGCFFLDRMSIWAATASGQNRDPFLSWRKASGEVFSLGYRTFLLALKQAMQARGFDPKDFGTHSLRRGAISQLVAAGVAAGVVQRFARHRNGATTAKYTVQSGQERETIFRTLTENQHFNELDMRAAAGDFREQRRGFLPSERDLEEEEQDL